MGPLVPKFWKTDDHSPTEHCSAGSEGPREWEEEEAQARWILGGNDECSRKKRFIMMRGNDGGSGKNDVKQRWRSKSSTFLYVI